MPRSDAALRRGGSETRPSSDRAPLVLCRGGSETRPSSGRAPLVLCRGGSETRPSSGRDVDFGLRLSVCLESRFARQRNIPQDNHPMHVIRHHHKHIQPHVRVMLRQPLPHPRHHPTRGIHLHRAVGNVPEQKHPTLRTDRHRIRARLRVVIPLQSQRLTIRQTLVLVPRNHANPCPTARPCIPSPQNTPPPPHAPVQSFVLAGLIPARPPRTLPTAHPAPRIVQPAGTSPPA